MNNVKRVVSLCGMIIIAGLFLTSCNTAKKAVVVGNPDFERPNEISKPLITDAFTADPSAHVFNGRIYVYPSHDEDTGASGPGGGQFDMRDYHVYSMKKAGGKVKDHGVILSLGDVDWASKQLWAPDAAEKNGTYYLYFPAKDKNGVFKIGVATASSPEGPFTPEAKPMQGAFSIDPAVFKDDDGTYYMYVGGIWGGQLQRWEDGEYAGNDASTTDHGKNSAPAISPRIARLSDDMLSLDENVKRISILDKSGNPILAGDHDRRFFEASWVHKYNGKYYFSYSTGDTHNICYATGDSPYGPFTYQGIILEPVLGWTNHHSIVEHKGEWQLFYHDTVLSGGQTHLRNIKMTKLTHNADGTIQMIDPYLD